MRKIGKTTIKNNYGFSNILIIFFGAILLVAISLSIYRTVNVNNYQNKQIAEYYEQKERDELQKQKDERPKTDLEIKNDEVISLLDKNKITSLKKASKIEEGYLEAVDFSPSESEPWISYLIFVPAKREGLKITDLSYLIKTKRSDGSKFTLYKNNIYFIDNWKEIHVLNLKTLEESKIVVKDTPIRNFYIKDDTIYFVNSAKLYSLNLKNNQVTQLTILNNINDFKNFEKRFTNEDISTVLKRYPFELVSAVNKNEIVVRNFFGQKQKRADGPYEVFDPFSPLVFNIETNTISEIPDNSEWPNYFYYRIFPLKVGNVQLSEDVNLDNFKRGYFKSNNLNFNNLEFYN